VLVFQLGTILNAVNYDVLMVLVGSLFFFSAYRYLYGSKKIDLAFLLAFAGLAALIKLVGFLFFVYLFILLCMKIKIKWNFKLIRQTGLVFLLFIVTFCWLNYLFPERFFNFYRLISRVLGGLPGASAAAGGNTLQPGFFNSVTDSFYFHTGWMGFKLDGSWYIVLKVFLLLSIAGVFSAFIARKRNPVCSGAEKKWLIYMLIVLVLHLFSLWLYYGSRPMSQGRYVYPLIIPVILLIYTGLHFIEKRLRFNRSYLAISFILFQVLLTVFAVVRIISVFYLEIASPHPGL